MTTKEKETNETTTIVKAPSQRVTNQVLEQISSLRQRGSITLPADYNVGNALNSAWLKLQTIVNKDSKPIIKAGQVDTSIVTLSSVVNALHDYVIQGLNVAKNQAYFIAYGNQLSCQRSYFGDMLLAERVMPGIVFDFDTIRKGETLVISKQIGKRGQVTTISHSEIAFPRDPEIVGAYCGVFTSDGECLGYDVFDMVRIKRSWCKSKTYKYSTKDKPSTHDEFPEEMSLRTVIRHRCKEIINSSNDSLLMESIIRQDVESVDGEIIEEAAEMANAEMLAIDPVADPETGEVIEPEAEPKELF